MSRRRLAAFWAISLGLAALDIASKHVVFSLVEMLPGRGPVVVPGLCYITPRLNTGFSWSILRNLPPQLTAAINLGIIALVVYYFFYSRDMRHNRMTLAAIALVALGAHARMLVRERIRDLPRVVGAAVVDHDDLAIEPAVVEVA